MKENDKKRREVHVASREELLGRSSGRSGESTRRRTAKTSQRQSEKRTSESSQKQSEKHTQRQNGDEVKRHSSTSQNRSTASGKRTSDPQKQKKKKKKKIKRAVRIALVLGVFILIAALLLIGIVNLLAGSKGKVRHAYAKTISSYQKRDDISRTILGNDVAKMLKKGDISQNFEIAVTDNTAGAANISLAGTINTNTSTKTADAQFTASYKDAAAAQLKMYTDNKQIMFSAPGIYDDWLSMDCENIMSQLAASQLGQELEVSADNDFSLKLFTDENSEGEVMLSLTDEVSQIFTKEMDSLSKKAEYTRLKEKKSVMIDGAEKRCRGYQLDIKGDDFKNSLVNVLSKLRKNKKIKSYLTEYAKIQYEDVALYKMLFDSPDKLVEEYYKEMDMTLEELNSASFIDTKAVVYLYKGVIADADFSTVYNIDQDQVKVDLKGGMFGGKRPYEDVSLVLTLDDSKQVLSASYTENTDNYDNTFVNTRSFVLGNGENDLDIETKLTFDKSTGVVNGSADLKTPSGGYVDINTSGNISKQSGMTRLDLQEIKLDYNNAFTLVMKGSYEVKAFKKKVDAPQGNITELFKADAAQLQQIKATIAQNFDTAVESLNKAIESIDGVSREVTEGQSETTTAVVSDGETPVTEETTLAETSDESSGESSDEAQADNEAA